MREVLLIRIGLETATHLILWSTIETILVEDTLVVAASIRVVHFLHAPARGRERVGIDLRIVATGVVGSLDHIKPSI